MLEGNDRKLAEEHIAPDNLRERIRKTGVLIRHNAGSVARHGLAGLLTTTAIGLYMAYDGTGDTHTTPAPAGTPSEAFAKLTPSEQKKTIEAMKNRLAKQASTAAQSPEQNYSPGQKRALESARADSEFRALAREAQSGAPDLENEKCITEKKNNPSLKCLPRGLTSQEKFLYKTAQTVGLENGLTKTGLLDKSEKLGQASPLVTLEVLALAGLTVGVGIGVNRAIKREANLMEAFNDIVGRNKSREAAASQKLQDELNSEMLNRMRGSTPASGGKKPIP